MNVLTDAVIRLQLSDGAVSASLPEVMARLAADEVRGFTALRPHQRHAVHTFLCLLGATACVRAGLDAPPQDAAGWARILRALTPDFPGDEPWCLVSSPDRPALLQPVAGPLAELKSQFETPDALDMLVTSKNHDLKAERMMAAAADDWLFALITLQTSEGFLGAGNYGISRMNGGFANRPGLSLAPPGGIGAHVMRDMRRLIELRQEMLDLHPEYRGDGPALLWLLPWDGTQSLPRAGLDPYYIEICRRVRLVETGGRLTARSAGSKVARIAMSKPEGGITGDPWAPIDRRKEDHKVLTVDARGFDYQRLSAIMFSPKDYEPAPLQVPGPDEKGKDWTLVCRALVRGQGKTEGYHERRVLIPAKTFGRMRRDEVRRDLGVLSEGRIKQAGALRSALRYALMVLFENGPDEFKPKDNSAAEHADPVLDRFQAEIDGDFFEALFVEAEAEDEPDRRAIRRKWLLDLLAGGQSLLRVAESGSPTSTIRRYRALVRAEAALHGAFRKNEHVRPYLEEEKHAA